MTARLVCEGGGTNEHRRFVARIFAVDPDGDLRFYRYTGDGTADPGGAAGWRTNSGNTIGTGWSDVQLLLGQGDGVILAVRTDGDLVWFRYTGDGEQDPSGSIGWHPNSGNVIGNGWHDARHVVARGRISSPFAHPALYTVDAEGLLHWYSYRGSGEHDPSGSTGWHPNSGNVIGDGWRDFEHVVGSVGPWIFAAHENGNLHWLHYRGEGEHDPIGSSEAWHPNSGNVIGNGWNGLRHLFCGQAVVEPPFGDEFSAMPCMPSRTTASCAGTTTPAMGSRTPTRCTAGTPTRATRSATAGDARRHLRRYARQGASEGARSAASLRDWRWRHSAGGKPGRYCRRSPRVGLVMTTRSIGCWTSLRRWR
ncbi:tachylectin-related carbohydrate-binding protein [Nocardia cyriacigeorgica]|uniref:tachylectin-related carbohydrate-binding protein n=1 Tax=Nocardia cyriacigeorgica TaxID=135487 RepID=UPI001892EF3A|nr:tachylectin-related carbohydrate-binding protein [Nocardia cyriacigeorgica]MBF6455263.1 hypothetical protein [Nocardia cyriacigeorgica]MBF6553995.1 hypothetical protein [Nocardia cyriacigeorgica]